MKISKHPDISHIITDMSSFFTVLNFNIGCAVVVAVLVYGNSKASQKISLPSTHTCTIAMHTEYQVYCSPTEIQFRDYTERKGIGEKGGNQ